MKDNWIRNSEGKMFNLDQLSQLYIYPTLNKKFEINAYNSSFNEVCHFEPMRFDTREQAQAHLDQMMKGKVWE